MTHPTNILLAMAKVVIEDLSGNTTTVTGNPYDGLISLTNNDSVWVTLFELIAPSENNCRSIYKHDMTSIEEAETDSRKPRS